MAKRSRLLSRNKTFFIFGCFQEHYKSLFSHKLFTDFLNQQRCPCCGEIGGYSYHCTYTKYLYDEQIPIQRVRCHRCRVTHAIIPEFSMPGRSCGTGEVDKLYANLRSGVSRQKAGNDFKEKNVGEDYPRDLVRSMKKYSRRLHSLLLETDLPPGDFLSPSLMPIRPVKQLNHLSLALGSNAVFCSRITILSYDLKRAGLGISLNPPSDARRQEILNSS